MKTKFLKKEKLSQLFEDLRKSGKTIVAPHEKGGKYYFSVVNSIDEVSMGIIQTAMSAKSYVFPRCEELIHYVYETGGKVRVEDSAPREGEIVIFGLHPCDAAAFDYLSTFFLKENPDAHLERRKDKITLIALSCNKADDYCFCTSVGISPGDTRGADMLLTQFPDGSYYAEVMTAKGEAVLEASASSFSDAAVQDKTPHLAKVTSKFDPESLYKKIDSFFDSPLWQEQSLSCLGCGACAFVCPTCSCFDIQDESNMLGGKRIRCWDTCAIGLFTLHASGHNPRSTQTARWRQRLKHKFEYTKETFDVISCVGCGRCARACPAQMNILEHILSISEGAQ